MGTKPDEKINDQENGNKILEYKPILPVFW